MKKIIIIPVLLIIIGAGAWYVCTKTNLLGFSIQKNEKIEKTPIDITKIKQIKQWEFLAISTEEVVDTVRKRTFFKDDEQCSIYNGTLRLGVNMEKASDDWATITDSSAIIKLPPIELLDDRFIDEASTRVFYENGQWDGTAQEQLYQKAVRQMKKRALTKENFARAEENGRQTFTRLFESFGIKHVEVSFTK